MHATCTSANIPKLKQKWVAVFDHYCPTCCQTCAVWASLERSSNLENRWGLSLHSQFEHWLGYAVTEAISRILPPLRLMLVTSESIRSNGTVIT